MSATLRAFDLTSISLLPLHARCAGGGADNVFSFGGFFGDRRFGLLPRVLVMVQFLAWTTVLYMLVDTVVNASSRAARKVWNRKINRFEEAPPSTTAAAAAEQEAKPGAAEAVTAATTGAQPAPAEAAAGAAGAALAAGGAAAGGGALHTSEVVMLEDEVVVVEELVTEEEPTHGSHGSLYGSPEDAKWRQALESALLGSAGHGTGGAASAGAGSAAAPGHSQVQEVADAALSAAAALPSMGWSPGHDATAGGPAGGQTGAAAAEAVVGGAAAGVAEAAGQGAAEAPHGGAAPRATFVKYSGERPIEYPVVALFVMIMGSVGFFSTLG